MIYSFGGALVRAYHGIIPLAIVTLRELSSTADLAFTAASASLICNGIIRLIVILSLWSVFYMLKLSSSKHRDHALIGPRVED